MPADVFKALDEIEYGFMREKLEAEFASASPVPLPHAAYPPTCHMLTSHVTNRIQPSPILQTLCLP